MGRKLPVVIACAACVILVPGFLAGCRNGGKAGLSVIGGEPVAYQSETGEKAVAKYFSLSDRSLDFVKVVMPDGKEYTLPRVMSASGVRYTDDMDLVWWTKGETATVQKRTESGEWDSAYVEFREVPGKN